jgi:hypothetical protein
MVAAARGDAATADRWLRALEPDFAGPVATILVASAGMPVDSLADAAAIHLRGYRGSRGAVVVGRWAAATWRLQKGDRAGAAALLDSLEAAADSTNQREVRLFGASLRARLALARGDSAAAIRALALVPTASQQVLRWSPWEALPWERMTLARLLAERGRRDEAYQIAETFDSPSSFGFAPWLAESLRLRAGWSRQAREEAYAKELTDRLASLGAGAPGS